MKTENIYSLAMSDIYVSGYTFDKLKKIEKDSRNNPNCKVAIYINDRLLDSNLNTRKIPIKVGVNGFPKHAIRKFDEIFNIVRNDNETENNISDKEITRVEVGTEQDLIDWNYELDEYNKIIKLKEYLNKNILNDLIVYSRYIKDGIIYRTSLEDGYRMFDNSCVSSIEFKSGIICTDLTSMAFMFAYCHNLTSIEGLENLDTSNVTNMSSVFYSCINLTSLDLSSFDTSNTKYIDGMFYGCYKLTELNISSFVCDKHDNIENMFNGCFNLKTLIVNKYLIKILKNELNKFFVYENKEEMWRLEGKNNKFAELVDTNTIVYTIKYKKEKI